MYIRRAVLPASPEGDAAPASNLVLLPLLSLSVVALILIFFVVRIVKRGLHFPNLTWLRGKGKGVKGRLGLSSVELLPTSFKSVPTSSPSPFSAAFNLEGNAGKNGNSTLLSRSSSLDALPQLSTSAPPPNLTSRRRSEWRTPFSLPAFLNTKNKPSHRRSKSLNSLHHTTSSSMPTSAPPTPPKTLLIDISTSDSSPMSASSDLGTHKLHSASPPLIPGLPIPTPSPVKMMPISKNDTQVWTSDVEGESDDIADIHVTDPLLAAFKRSRPEIHAKPLPHPIPLIQYDEPSYPPPSTSSLVPRQLSTGNPFANLVDSFTSQPFISDRPATSSLSTTPSSPPGIELTPMKPTAVESTVNLVDFSDDDVEVGHDMKTPLLTGSAGSTERTVFVDSLITAVDGVVSTHDAHVETPIDLVEVSDPFDDSHAVTLAAADAWNFEPALPLVEGSGIPTGELSPLITPSKPVHSSPILASSLVLSSEVEPEEVEVASPAEPEAFSSDWQWNGDWNPPSIPAHLPASECSLVTSSPGETGLDGDADSKKLETGNDLMSFDHAEPVIVDEPVQRLRSAVEPDNHVDKQIDPADTWFTEEPTAVWDVSWTGEDVKEGVLLDMGREGKVKDDEVDVPQEEHINIFDELLVGPSEPIKIHVFEEMVEDIFSDQTIAEDSEASAAATSSNDIHDIHETIMPHSNITTPIIHAVTPLLSTPEKPNTPLPEFPSPVSVTSLPTVEECPDPDIMPLPDYPPSTVASTPISPVPVKPQPRSIQQAQTPTPPDSPQPWSNASARPLWSLRATDAPALGLPAAAAAIPPVPEVSEETKLVVEVESKTEEADCVVDVESVKEDAVVEKDIEPAADGLPPKPEEQSTSTKPQPTSIPGSFPASPSKAAAVALPADVAPSSSAPLTDSLSTNVRHRVRAAIPTSNRIRTPRSVIDVALAMQLRPGLGAGADPAWMVRFLMAVFGWFAILVSGDL